jgi:hypothetical protein
VNIQAAETVLEGLFEQMPDSLDMHAAANAAMLHWLKAPSLPRPFVMDLLDFVLGNSAPLFRELPAFEHALLLRVCSLLTTQLQNLLDPMCEPALQASNLRVTLRTTRTVIHHFHHQLRSKCGVFIETLLAGVAAFKEGIPPRLVRCVPLSPRRWIRARAWQQFLPAR